MGSVLAMAFKIRLNRESLPHHPIARGLEMPRAICLAFSLGIIFGVSPVRGQEAVHQAKAEFFERKVRPVLVEHCFSCHSMTAKKIKGKLSLDHRADLLKGGETGPAIEPGNADKSLLIRAIRYSDVDLLMPPKAKLPENVIADLTKWVNDGAYWPDSATTKIAGKSDEIDIEKRKREHWAWQPIRNPAVPTARDPEWARSPVDAFILSKIDEKKLKLAARADRRTLLRRVHFVLTGLPPRPDEVEAFANDHSPEAFEKVVDRLLASPRFGERWARHWLDLVRYAESRGHEFDYTIPNAYQYRDYVIRAFNADVPYHQLVLEHLAGDLLPEPRKNPTEGFNESILGTGFWFLGEEIHSPVDIRMDQAERFDNRIDVFTKSFMGLTVSCARCHDHKFDPIPSTDYYGLFGFLESSGARQVRFDTILEHRKIAESLDQLYSKARSAWRQSEADRFAKSAFDSRYLVSADAVFRVPPAQRMNAIKKVVSEQKLDPSQLDRWLGQFQEAEKNEKHPLHLLAIADHQLGRWLEKRTVSNPSETIVDYAHPQPGQWLADDASFGLRPVRPGDVRFTGKGQVRFIDYYAGEYDPFWNGLTTAPGTEGEPGALGSLPRAGRTLRTPNFEVKKDRVWYLVKGVGRAYAAVAQHAMLAGPLHGELLQSINTQGKFQWISHNLAKYAGAKGYLEFTPKEGENLSIAKVVQSDSPPNLFDALPSSVLYERGKLPANPKRSDLVSAHERVFQASWQRWIHGQLGDDDKDQELARFVGWLLEHPELRGSGMDPRAEEWSKVVHSLHQEWNGLIKSRPTVSRLAPAIQDGTGLDEFVFVRGSPKVFGKPAPRRFLQALSKDTSMPIKTGSGRLDLARMILDPKQDPFAPRVAVNRVWHHVFGRGLVPSVDNFGVLGEAPSHPELLDFLADRFVREGWSMKKLIRSLVLSRTFQSSSQADKDTESVDPENLWLSHMRVRRLEGEVLRDSILAVSGRLNSKMYGPPVPVNLTDFQQGRGRPASGPVDGDGRRSIYLSVRRNFLSSFLLAFDTPIPFSTVGKRSVSNVPAQALILMNDPFVHQQTSVWAQRLLKEQPDTSARLRTMYLEAFSRPATEAEESTCRSFLTAAQKEKVAEPRAWADLAHVLWNTKEFYFVR